MHGLISIYVDDFCWGGSTIFTENVINCIKKTFEIGREYSCVFKYVGLNIKQTGEKICLDQISYIQGIHPMTIDRRGGSALNNDALDIEEKKQLRVLAGQLNWVATQSRPDILFDCCWIMSKINNATIAEVKLANKILRQMKNKNVELTFPNLGNLDEVKFIVYHDASFGNLSGGGSEGGYFIVLSNEQENIISPIAWQSKRIKRVVKSTLGAETLAQVEAAETCLWLANILSEIISGNHSYMKHTRIECRTDSYSLYEAVYSTTSLLDKRLRIDIAIMREALDKKEIEKVTWIPKSRQMADCLTKHGASSEKLLDTIGGSKI